MLQYTGSKLGGQLYCSEARGNRPVFWNSKVQPGHLTESDFYTMLIVLITHFNLIYSSLLLSS